VTKIARSRKTLANQDKSGVRTPTQKKAQAFYGLGSNQLQGGQREDTRIRALSARAD
jgi:hypothetical protein